MQTVRNLLRSGPLHRPRTAARKLYYEHVDRPLWDLHRIAAQFRRGRADVVYFGESSLVHVSPQDRDMRRLSEMVAAEAGRVVNPYYGPAYPPELWSEVVRILMTLKQRPRAIVLPLCIRVSIATHVKQHPAHGYAASVERMRTITNARSWWSPLKATGAPGPEEYAAFEAIPVKTRWGLGSTVGDFRSVLHGYNHSAREIPQQRALFDYFHGESAAESLLLECLTGLAEQLKRYGVPVVTYHTPICTEVGDQLFDGEFSPHIEANYDALRRTFFKALPEARFVEIPPIPSSGFVDPLDGTEHLNESGRRVVARLLGESISEESGPRR